MVVQLTIENVNARLISDPPELFSDQYVLSSKEEFSKENSDHRMEENGV